MKLKALIVLITLVLIALNLIKTSDSDYTNWILNENVKYFLAGLDELTHFPYDHISIAEDGSFQYGEYTSPTVIGFWMLFLTNVIKEDVKLDNLSKDQAEQLLAKAVESLKSAPRWFGLFYWYELEGKIKVAEEESLSSYDNGNLSLSLMAVAGAFSKPENSFQEIIKKDIQDILSEQKTGWQKLYDQNKGLLYGGYKYGKPVASLWIDRFYTEARTAAVAAILLADLPKQVWFNLLRSGNCPRSEYILSDGSSVSFFKPWQGAFQAWMPLLFIPECDLSPALKKAHNNYAAIQLDYASNSNVKLLRSAAARPGCAEYVYEPCIGIFNASEDWVRSDIGSPHATALLYPLNPNAAVDLFKKALKDFPDLIGPLGFYDSVSESGAIAKVYLALDQLQMLLAFVSGANQQYLLDYLDSEGKLEALKSLYAKIQF